MNNRKLKIEKRQEKEEIERMSYNKDKWSIEA